MFTDEEGKKTVQQLLQDKEILAKVKRILRINDEEIHRANRWHGARRRLGLSTHRDPEDRACADRLTLVLEHIYSTVGKDPDKVPIETAYALGQLLLREPWLLPLFEGKDSDEFYTPQEFIDTARNVMGSIDVDAASNDWANENLIKAPVYYTAKNSGLNKKWEGNVWLNPPYSGELCKKFIHKLLKEHEAGRCKQAVVLCIMLPAGSKTKNALRDTAKAMCMVRDRIKFVRPNTDETQAIQFQSVFYYLGQHVGAFRREFNKWGPIHTRV